ncbi:MAG TPA: HEAT repeat domain-containing protein [Vicingaceae bacterium]|nr:HEAT repeat domain-containing protein [Vicingaceae bacterium]
MAVKRNDNKFNNIVKDLQTKDVNKVLTAIKQLRKSGKPEAIPPLLEVYLSKPEEEIKQAITELLFDLKADNTTVAIINAIENEKYSSIQPFLISVLWQSSLDASPHIAFLVQQAIDGSYLSCLEVLTVIENFDATFNEDEINDLVYDLEEAIEYEEDEEKQKLLISLRMVLQQLNIEF